ncbi:hypothetical protein P4493_05485 [Bacillus thuringiensis]|jgi:hypothetical protein|uniref:Uncharacterized protein n=3 Tax=Bacillus thuringiensis TaxID=1428 RepID=A0A0B5NKR3_BACTU|nr:MULTISPECIES: hypothetical protein [Bacillus]MEC2534072.1 hypothetical protein [Bacillus cereus]MED1153551.1 hypothetical protein [Bacillus paranthracis]OUB09158.1 hypothetical protein BK708_31970 [Bacillus thuringiensis serovar yunnanensis]AFQ29879.1 hypothetical protein BTF1_28892 [Bacillus thuringiensis HD-789]AJG73987.1 hypothetical protein BF38_5666 [Bacillus thuringiensis]
MYPKELLKKYSEKKEDSTQLLSMQGVVEIDKGKDSSEYMEIETRLKELENEMTDIAKVFIESFI